MHSIQPAPQHQRTIANWLMVCLALVSLMVFIGGVTRLTESGLSIVEWKLLSGTLPPMTDIAWHAEFEEYKATPQFKQVNHHFELPDFKRIYWLEYLHRLLGRVIGLAVLLPFAYFTARRMLPRRLFWRGLAIGGLVAAQGTVGWVMVASGLDDQPRVAPIKLASHLLLAFTVFSVMLWTRWQVLGHTRPVLPKNYAHAARALLLLVVIQIFFGALVAGLRAGLSYNSYPLMDGQLIPNGLHLMQPWWLNHLESVLTVQFQHRIGAVVVVAAMIGFISYAWRITPLYPALRWIGILTIVQFGLGVATLLTGVNMWLASAHQLVALALVAWLVRVIYLTPMNGNPHTPQINNLK